jgi:hypothetical protein
MTISTRRLWKKASGLMKKRASLLLGERCERGVEAAFAAGTHDQNLLPGGACCRLQISRIDVDVRIIRVHEYADQRNPRR